MHNISGESLAGGIPAGEWEHSKRGIGTGNLSCQSCRLCLPCHDFDASFRDGKNTENACSVMNLTAGSSQSTKNVFRRGLWLRFSPHGKLVNSAVSKTHGTSVLFLEIENRWKYARHGSVADVGSISRPGSRTASK